MVKERKDSEKYDVLFDKETVPQDVSDVICIYETKSGTQFFQNMMTGKRGSDYDSVIRYPQRHYSCHARNYENSDCGLSNILYGFYSEYNEEFDVIVVYSAILYLDNPKEGEERQWQEVFADYIYLRDGTVYMNSNVVYPSILKEMYDICAQTIYLNGSANYSEFDYDATVIHPHNNDVCRKLYGDAYGAAYSYVSYSLKAVNPFSQICEVTMAHPFLQDIELANETIGKDTDLKEIDVKDFRQFFATKSGKNPNNESRGFNSLEVNTACYLKKELMIGFLQSIREGESVIRIYMVRADVRGFMIQADDDDLLYKEMIRIYYKNGELSAMKNYFGKWVQQPDYEIIRFIMLPWKPEDSVGTPFAYLDDTIESTFNHCFEFDMEENKIQNYYDYYFRTERLATRILDMLRVPHLDELFQSPFENIKQILAGRLDEENFDQIVNEVLGVYMDCVPLDQTVMEVLDTPVHMLQTVDKLIGEYSEGKGFDGDNKRYMVSGTAFSAMKEFFRSVPEYFKSMNKEQYEDLCRTYIENKSCQRNVDLIEELDSSITTIRGIVAMRGPQNTKEYIKYVYAFLGSDIKKDEIPISHTSGEVILQLEHLYKDYISMAHSLQENGVIEKPEWRFKTFEEVQKAHDDILPIYNQFTNEEEAEKYRKKFEEQKPNWDKYLYSENEYSVVAPQTPYDIINEGYSLRHCVKSYLNRISNGDTDIVFVRRSKELEKPFYTLEVRNGMIRQCHGFDNCNVSEENGLDGFLQRFCKKTHVTYGNCDGVLAAN